MRTVGGQMRNSLLMAVLALFVGCAHARPSEPGVHVVSKDASGLGSALGTGGAGGHDCQQEHEECMARCWQNRYPYPHSEEQSGWYYKRCVSDCSAQYNECMNEQEEAERKRDKQLRFSDVERAVAWLREHKAEVSLGTVVVVGGVAFVLTVGVAGALVLAPLAL
jgi:ribulose kinase